MDHKEAHFDFLTQRFIAKRWTTPTGKEVREKLSEAIENSEDIRKILEPHVLDHPANTDPYNYPYYPIDAMEHAEFWVLTVHDLRGIAFENKNFFASLSLVKANLNFAKFVRCNLSNVDFKKTNLIAALFVECNLTAAVFEYARGIETSFLNSNLNDAGFLEVELIKPDFSGSNLLGVHFENTILEDITVNYLTKFDKEVHIKWYKRGTSMKYLPDLYRAIRVGYERANLLQKADFYLIQEKTAYRRYVLWPQLVQKKSIMNFLIWLKDFLGSKLSGYGTSPIRTFWYGFLVSLIYAIIYTLAGVPKELYSYESDLLSAIYLSFTTFSTLGYGDIVYDQSRMYMRLLCTSEAWIGAIFIAFFVVIFSRKILR